VIDPGGVAQLELPGSAIQGEASRPAQSYWNESWERLRANRIGVFCGILILALALIAIAAPLFTQFVTHFDPTRQHLVDNFRPPATRISSEPTSWVATPSRGSSTEAG
jgi:ABC-type antimicrobial peptide transport system permease subunit